MNFSTYTPSPIRANLIPEGMYKCKVVNVDYGTRRDGGEYMRIECIVNADGFPRVSLFLSDGANFNGAATAFFDTFGIERGNFTTGSWMGKTGTLEIVHVKTKDKNDPSKEYTNLQARYVVDESGYARCAARQPVAEEPFTDDIPF